jgi:hypothetical protein
METAQLIEEAHTRKSARRLAHSKTWRMLLRADE